MENNLEFDLNLNEEELRKSIREKLTKLMENSSDSLSNEHGENVKPEAIQETTDTERYEEVVFMQGHDAEEAMDILNNDGKDAAMEYLKQWHEPGNHMGRENPGHGNMDRKYEKDGYIMAWNPYLPYIGLVYDTEHNMNEDSQMFRHQASQRGKIGNAPLGKHSPHSPHAK